MSTSDGNDDTDARAEDWALSSDDEFESGGYHERLAATYRSRHAGWQAPQGPEGLGRQQWPAQLQQPLAARQAPQDPSPSVKKENSVSHRSSTGSSCAPSGDWISSDSDAPPARALKHGHQQLPRVDWSADVVTVMVRQIPRTFDQSMFIAEVARRGYQGLFDFIYLPLDTKKGKNVGYGFVNFTKPKYAKMFLRDLDGCYLDAQMQAEGKPVRVHPASVQGYEANYAQFVEAKPGQQRDPRLGPLFLPGGGYAGALR